MFLTYHSSVVLPPLNLAHWTLLDPAEPQVSLLNTLLTPLPSLAHRHSTAPQRNQSHPLHSLSTLVIIFRRSLSAAFYAMAYLPLFFCSYTAYYYVIRVTRHNRCSLVICHDGLFLYRMP